MPRQNKNICVLLLKRTEQMVYLKIPVGNNAHEDTQHTILFTNMAEDSVMCYYFISSQWWRRFYKMICQQASTCSYNITA